MATSVIPIEDMGYHFIGELTRWVKQPVDGSPSESANGILTLREKWKGPYDWGRQLLGQIKVGDSITNVYNHLDGAGGWPVYKYNYPPCPSRNGNTGYWILTDISIDECDPAGQHCYLNLTYQPSYYGDTSITTLIDVPEQDVWSMSWGSYTANPWYFAADGDYYTKRYKEPNQWFQKYYNEPPTPNWSACASRSDIEFALNHNPEFIEPFIIYTPNPDKPGFKLYLEPASFYLAKKVKLDRSAVYHYPIVVHQTVKRGPWSMNYYDSMAENIDTIQDIPDECPYTFATNWIFIRTADDITQTKDATSQTVSYTRRVQWEGVLKDSVDYNYYLNWPAEHSENGIKNGRWATRWL